MRIRTKFIILFFAIALGPLTLVGSIAYRNGRRAIEDSLGLLFEQRATRTIEALDREVLGLLGSGQAWAGLERMQDVLDDDRNGRIAALLIQLVQHNELVSRAVVKSPAGVVVAGSHPDWIGRVEPSAGSSVVAHEYACHDERGQAGAPLLTCEFPIRAAFDEIKLLGTLSVSWNTGRLPSRVRTEAAPGGPQGDLLLLGRDGLVVSGPQSLKEGMSGRDLLERGSRAALFAGAGRSGFLVEALGGAEYLVGYAHSSGSLGWSALVVQDVATAFAPAYRLRRIVLGVGALVAVASLMLSVMLARRTTRPLLDIAAGARRVASGDLDTRLAMRSHDEIGSLAESFNLMVLDLKRQREQLVDKDFVDSILSNMVDGLMVVDRDGVVERANRALIEMMASREERIVGRRAGSLFHDGFDVYRERVLAVALRGEPARGVELSLAAEDGRHVPVILSAALLPADRRGRRSIVCIAADISRRKESEEALVKARKIAEAAAQAKAQFLATVSHEIRTPLNGIIGMTELLSGTRLTSQQREYAETARRSSEVLLSVLNDILDFSKMDAGKLALETIEFDLRSCIEGVGDILALKAREKGLELSIRTDPLLPERVLGDPARLRQVLLNLGGNAVKFTAKGEVAIRSEPERERPGWVRFVVADTGIGIPATLQARLFEPFSQVDASTTRRYGGTGLGLAIAKEVVELMRGEIGFRSEEGHGSTFSFSVELLPAKAEPAELEPRRPRLAGLRVLVVDDNATNRYVLREMLGAWDCAVDEAADAWEGLEKLRAAAGNPREFELALIDFQMPEMDGGQLAQEIRRDPRLARTPLILLTSMPQHGDAAQMMDFGFSAYLTKPVKQAVLHDAIAAVLGVRENASKPQLKLVTAHTVGEATRVRRRILVVADSAARQQAALHALEKEGYACDIASSGEEAVRTLTGRSYDLVFMESRMPGMDGYEATRRIRLNEQGGQRTPIVAVALEDGDAGPWRQAGMDDWIRFSANPEELCRVAERYAPAAPVDDAKGA